jgi:prepilin-type N-terminal cleavage/methylation domain-containing protein
MKKATAFRKTGFTLVEIMIVVAIIGLLAAIAIPNFLRARSTAQQNACIDNLRKIDSVKQQWALERGQPVTALPSEADLQPYLGRGLNGDVNEVYCPLDANKTFGTSYGIGNIATLPVCLVAGENEPRFDENYPHVLN